MTNRNNLSVIIVNGIKRKACECVPVKGGEGGGQSPPEHPHVWHPQGLGARCLLPAAGRDGAGDGPGDGPWGWAQPLPLPQPGVPSGATSVLPAPVVVWAGACAHTQLEVFPPREHALLSLCLYSLWALSFINSLLQYCISYSFGKIVQYLIRRTGCFGTPEY